jgi:sulfatase maturation enzyme AslB (radical SAM superfamily)
MTGYMKRSEFGDMMNRVDKVIGLAKVADATSVLFTSKGEALQNFEQLIKLLEKFSPHFFCEVQTNGLRLTKEPWLVPMLVEKGLSTLAVSIDHFYFDHMRPFLESAKNLNITTRATINLWDKTYEHSPEEWIEKLKSFGFNQASFRDLSIPEKCADTEESREAQEWIKIHAKKNDAWKKQMENLIATKGRKIRKLNFGPTVYGIDGVGVIHFPYCIQESNDGDDVRSLIFQEDAHLYDNWDDPASIIF